MSGKWVGGKGGGGGMVEGAGHCFLDRYSQLALQTGKQGKRHLENGMLEGIALVKPVPVGNSYVPVHPSPSPKGVVISASQPCHPK